MGRDATGRRQGGCEGEERDEEKRHEQPGNPARLPFFWMRAQVRLVAHHVPLTERQRSNRRRFRLTDQTPSGAASSGQRLRLVAGVAGRGNHPEEPYWMGTLMFSRERLPGPLRRGLRGIPFSWRPLLPLSSRYLRRRQAR